MKTAQCSLWKFNTSLYLMFIDSIVLIPSSQNIQLWDLRKLFKEHTLNFHSLSMSEAAAFRN